MNESEAHVAGDLAVDLVVRTTTHIGLVHHTNEDSFAVFDTPTGRLLAVCDGMGGMGRGDEASRIAVEVLEEELSASTGFAPTRLGTAIRKADVVIRKRLAVGPGNTPGSTAVLVHIENGLAHVAWAGDSRAYFLRRGAVLERTRDHKLVNELVDAGELTEAEAKQSSLAHVVTKALGGRGPNEPPIQPDVLPHPWKLHNGDLILLCSDGLCDLVDDHELRDLVGGVDLDEDVARLQATALDRGGHDNITIVLARWDGVDFDEEAHQTPVLSDAREHHPLAPDRSIEDNLDLDFEAERTWDELPARPPRLPSEADQETIPPAPDRRGTPFPADARDPWQDPASRERAASEIPQRWIALGVALLAFGLILVGLLLAQGVFTNNVNLDVDEAPGE